MIRGGFWEGYRGGYCIYFISKKRVNLGRILEGVTMPKKDDIIDGLQSIVNDYSTFAIIWHVIFYLLLAGLMANWDPSNKLLGILICLPLVSVAVFAWLNGNPFNGSLFTLMTILICIFSVRGSNEPVVVSQLPFMIIGILMIVFGLVYPHFIQANSFFKYLYASPVGLVPCPTLSILIGILLLFNGLGSQPLTLTFIAFGLFYGLFGALKLSVYLDIFLVFGSVSLLVKFFLR